ncbi:MAG: hypothetical protein Q7S36_02705 [Candidatus Liptonbacteria bacterium]|nr:hypothetical protein [Candidatus Liptonbacteria bacterium]
MKIQGVLERTDRKTKKPHMILALTTDSPEEINPLLHLRDKINRNNMSVRDVCFATILAKNEPPSPDNPVNRVTVELIFER